MILNLKPCFQNARVEQKIWAVPLEKTSSESAQFFAPYTVHYPKQHRHEGYSKELGWEFVLL